MRQFRVYIEDRLKKIWCTCWSLHIKQTRHVHFVFETSFISLNNDTNILSFIYEKWIKEKLQFLDYKINHPILIHSTKWQFDYVLFRNNESKKWIWIRFNDQIIFRSHEKIYIYSTRHYQMRVTKSDEKWLNILFQNIAFISKSFYNYFCLKLRFITYNFFTLLCFETRWKIQFSFFNL